MATLNPDGTIDFRSEAQREFGRVSDAMLKRCIDELLKPSPFAEMFRAQIVMPDGSPARPAKPAPTTIRFRRWKLPSTD